MRRSYGTLITVPLPFPWIKIHGYNMGRTYGSVTLKRALGSDDVVTVD